MGIGDGAGQLAQARPKLIDVLVRLGQKIGKIDPVRIEAAYALKNKLRAPVVAVHITFYAHHVVGFEGVNVLADVVPHLGLDLAGAIAQHDRQVVAAASLGLELFGYHQKGRLQFALPGIVGARGGIGGVKAFHVSCLWDLSPNRVCIAELVFLSYQQIGIRQEPVCDNSTPVLL